MQSILKREQPLVGEGGNSIHANPFDIDSSIFTSYNSYSVTANNIIDGEGQKNPKYSDRSCRWNYNHSIGSSIIQVVRVQG